MAKASTKIWVATLLGIGLMFITLSIATVIALPSLIPFRPLGHFSRELVNGYVVSGYSAEVIVIQTPARFKDHPSNCAFEHAILAKVDGVVAVDHWILGHASSTNKPHYADDECLGYFIINTRSGEVRHGLSQSAWESAAHAIGITSIPELMNP